LDRRLSGPQSRPERSGKEKNPNFCRESSPSHPAPSLVTILTELPWLLLREGERRITLAVKSALYPLNKQHAGRTTPGKPKNKVSDIRNNRINKEEEMKGRKMTIKQKLRIDFILFYFKTQKLKLTNSHKVTFFPASFLP
jgi:hypothetical protein